MIRTADFLRKVRKIADGRPSYRTGGIGADGTCDCIGLIMGAMYANGQEDYPLHSSNYFARCQTRGLARIEKQTQLLPGMIVYKASEDPSGLNARYLSGGRYDNGDRLDYYHAGVVETAEPLCIVHCTAAGAVSGIVRDGSADGWTHCGRVCGVDDDPTQILFSAVVCAASGSTVNLRARPEPHAPVLARIPLGETAAVHECADGWAQITHNGMTGYMMERFLRREPEAGQVNLPLDSALEIIRMLNEAVLASGEEENT